MRTDYATDNYILTEYDCENWWNFLENEYPENYDLACKYYSDEDEIFMEEGYRPGNFDVNDYFTIYGLPRITARKGYITVNGEFVKRYDNFEGWKALRDEFEELKKTDLFRKWKEEEYICQDKKCAWCKRYINIHLPCTHTDHIKPLITNGDNSLSNLVLTCSRCNRIKGTKGRGYNSTMNKEYYNAKPSWIKPNKYAEEELSDSYEYLYDNELDLSEVPF
ncbi:HNH endonuclease [Candidatus Saccharibacteria bacterium]|nr:HNH endonuclease [Candidatus Saccharibacteria bacterium]